MDQTNNDVERFKERQRKYIELIKDTLAEWITRQNGPVPADVDPREVPFLGPYVEINAALLETAIDRMLVLLGSADAREFLLKIYDRRLAAYKKGLM